MKQPPELLDGARLVKWSALDDRHRRTRNCRHLVAGVIRRPAAGLAICQYDGERTCYLFGCDSEWNVVTDTCHESLEDAEEQAEFEIEGVSRTWTIA